MVLRSDYDAQVARQIAAREEFIATYCADWPTLYKAQIPCTYVGAELMQAREEILHMLESDFATWGQQKSSPWVSSVAQAKCHRVDWSGTNSTELQAMALRVERPLGMPGAVKEGEGIDPADGTEKLYGDFVEVKEANDNAPRTAEWVAFASVRAAMREYEAISQELSSIREGADESTINALQAKLDAAAEATAKVEAKFKSLRKNPARGLKIVRELPEGFDSGYELR